MKLLNRLNDIVHKIGWPRLIIGIFLLVLFIACPFVDVKQEFAITNTISRFGMNLVLILSLVPMIQTGCGLNFGIPIGIVSGVFGAVCSIQFECRGVFGIAVAMAIGVAVAALAGLLYGYILNKVKGDEMIISTYIGLAFIAFMSLFWVQLLPVTNPVLLWGYGGSGMRQSVNLDGYWARVISNVMSFKIGPIVEIPTGMLLFGGFCCFLMWLFFRSKLGTAMTAVGSNPDYALASGININRTRLISVVMSTCIAAIGIIAYAQNFTFIQLYQAPFNYTFPTIAAVLIGGATINKASIKNVLIGALLFQGVVTIGPMVVGSALSDMADDVRLIISNGMIIYALTRKGRT